MLRNVLARLNDDCRMGSVVCKRWRNILMQECDVFRTIRTIHSNTVNGSLFGLLKHLADIGIAVTVKQITLDDARHLDAFTDLLRNVHVHVENIRFDGPEPDQCLFPPA